MIKTLVFAMTVTVLAFACGGGEGGGGVDEDKTIGSLTADEVADVCDFVADVFPARTVTCDGQSQTIGTTAAECISDFQESECTATVGDAEDCAEALGDLSDDELCNLSDPPAACAALADC
ncbi:MAG: hypothetical protein ABI867_07405 [Kofleriaceae bacterium]